MIRKLSSTSPANRRLRDSTDVSQTREAPTWTHAVTTAYVSGDEGVRALTDVAARYDVRHMSAESLTAMAKELEQRGVINFKGFALLSFHSELETSDKSLRPFQIEHLTRADAFGRRDWIDECKAQVVRWSSRPECASYVEHQREILALLQSIDTARSEIGELDAA